MNLYDVLNKLSDIANKHKLIGSYHNGDVYRIMNSAKNTYPVVVFTVDKLQNYQDYSTLNAYMYFIDRLTDDEDNKINVQSNGINVINDIVNKLCEINEISVPTPLQYTFFTEKFGDMCCGVYANVSIQFNNYSNCCDNFNINTLDISENGEYILDNIDVVTVNVQPKSSTITITENGVYNPADYQTEFFNEVTVNVQPNLQNKDVTITKNGTTTITKDNGYDGLGNVTVTTNVEGGGSIGNYIKVETPIKGGNNILYSIYDTLDTSNWEFNIQLYRDIFHNIPTKKIILPIDFFYKENRNDFNEESTFKNCSSLTEIENIDKTRISINRFSNTFSYCSKLTSLDLSYKPEYNYWDMSGVKDISYMFNQCNSLTTLNIDGWDRAKLSYSRYSFGSCNNLEGIIRLSAHNAIDNSYMFGCHKIKEIYYDNDGYDNIDPNSEVCDMTTFASNCIHLKKVSIKGRIIHKDSSMFERSFELEWVDMTGCDYSKYMSGNTSTSYIQPYRGCTILKTLIGDHTLQEVENGDITIYDGLGLSQPRFGTYYFSPLSSLRYSSMLAIAKGLGQHTYSSTQYIRLNQTAWDNMYNDDDTIPDSNTITARQTTITDLITGKGWRIQYGTN